MPQTAETPAVRPGGLVTVAFLKAQLDEGSDHLGIFMPLVLDVLAQLPTQSFVTEDVQDALITHHGVAMPQQTVATLLKRATSKKYLQRESGRYRRNPTHPLPPSNVAVEKARIEKSQHSLATALQDHAIRRRLMVGSTEAALQMLLRFLEDEQIAMLLGSPPQTMHAPDVSQRERAVVAEFVQSAITNDPALMAALRAMLEGLVLYHAAFLPDLAVASRSFKDLRVVFDSNVVRQALGYEGVAMQTLMREAIDVLKGSGAQCLVFDKTVHEIQRILALYEARLATEKGRSSLRPVPMTRHFLTQRYSPSDVREMSALLELEIVAAGFQFVRAPSRIQEHTAGERDLAARLAHPGKRDDLEPRVVHDVDCVAGILTLRAGHRSATIDNARAVFATASVLVVRNTRLWWDEDEHETGIEPVVHIRALTNVAWLKKPLMSSDFKIRELVALCSAALRPAQATWERFLRHLQSLQRSQKLSSDGVTAILVSAMSDKLLREAEFAEDDPRDIDAVTLDDVVDRVINDYTAKADERVQMVANDYEGRLAEVVAEARKATARADEVERTAAEKSRRRGLFIEGRSRFWARCLTGGIRWAVSIPVICGAVALIAGHPWHGGWLGAVIGFAMVFFVALELLGILGHLSEWCASAEARLVKRFRGWLGDDSQA